MERILTAFLMASLAMFTFTLTATSQITGGTIAGEVRNQANQPVSGAKVTARNLSTNQTRIVMSDDEGLYRLASLPVGSYEITFEADSYTSAHRQLNLRVNENAKVGVELVAAGSSESVQVLG